MTRLARRYAAPVAVVRRDDVPAELVWRGRRHVVQEVLDHWWVTPAWWEGAGRAVDDEHERWRLETRRSDGAITVLDLSFSWSTGTWTVVAVLD